MANVDPKPGDRDIGIPSGAIEITVPPATLWQTYSYGLGVRDAVLKRDFGSLFRYFPVEKKRGVIQKFKEIPKDLAPSALVRAALDCGGVEFQAFQQLVAFRDGLVHASASADTGTAPPAWL